MSVYLHSVVSFQFSSLVVVFFCCNKLRKTCRLQLATLFNKITKKFATIYNLKALIKKVKKMLFGRRWQRKGGENMQNTRKVGWNFKKIWEKIAKKWWNGRGNRGVLLSKSSQLKFSTLWVTVLSLCTSSLEKKRISIIGRWPLAVLRKLTQLPEVKNIDCC